MKYLFIIFLSITTIFTSLAQDSLNMKRVGILNALSIPDSTALDFNDIWGYTHGAKEYAILGGAATINIVDVTDCSNPTMVHQWADGSTVIWRDFKDYKDYIYGVCDGGACGEGLQIINKNDFSQSQSTSVFIQAHNIYIEKATGRLYVVGTNNSSGGRRGMHIYDLNEDPGNPTLLATVNMNNLVGDEESPNYYIHDLYVENDTAYCSNIYKNKMSIWDVRDVSNIYKISEGEGIGGYNHSNWKHPDAPYIYMATETHGKAISIYDIADIENPNIVHTFKDVHLSGLTNNIAHNPFVYLNRLYISYYHDGIKVYDVSDPVDPEYIGFYDTYPDNTSYSGYEGSWGVYPFLPSGCILAADITYGLNTLKMTLIPESKSIVTGSFLIDDSDKGIVFLTLDDEYKRLTVDELGKLTLETLASGPTDKTEIVNSNIQFSSESTINSIILKNSLGNYYRIIVTDMGNVTAIPELTLPTNIITLPSEDLFFSSYRGGFILKSSVGDCYHYNVGEDGLVETVTIDCD